MVEEKIKTLANVSIQNIFSFFNEQEHLSIKAIKKSMRKTHMIKTTA